jgi:hypothetical protein
LNVDAPDDVAEQLEEIALALYARWHLDPALAASVVERWVAGDDLHAASNWTYLHELPEYWAGWLFHRFVLHGDGACGDECRIEAWKIRQNGRRPIEPDAVLLLGMPTTSTAELLARAATRRGLEVRRVAGPKDLNGLTGRAVHWYGGPLAASRVVGRFGIGLLEPDDGWLPRLGRRFTGRRIESATLSDAWALTKPAFVKPPSDKSFPAQVYPDGSHVPRQGDALTPDTRVLISDVMSLVAEYRLFLLDGQVAAASRYAVHGRLDAAPVEGDPREREVRAFAAMLTRRLRYSLPSAVVLDIGLARDPDTGHERWVVVEANMAWFAHCYAADVDRVLDVVLCSAAPLREIAETDFEYLRSRAT